ncbi:MAG: 3-phosphoshikimate 1-carboxyvinyltransferase [Methanobacterium sp.]|nr:3-phosphoshikimate 1-carboxyvinyltransferase [Methanobacterium sp.]
MELLVERADKIGGIVKAPPSKSYTHRAILLACLAQGKSRLEDPLYSEDTLATLDACKALGCEIEKYDDYCIVHGTSGRLKNLGKVLDLQNSGTTLRFLTTMASLAPGQTMLTGDDSLKKRPMQDLLDSLKPLGVEAFSKKGNGLPPITVESGFRGGETKIKGDVSSQYISSILLSAPYAQTPVDLEVVGEFKSRPYVDMTLDIMEKFGVNTQQGNDNTYHIPNQTYHSQDYTIEGDYSSASYLIAAAAILHGEITVRNLFLDSKQGDKVILDVVKQMGADIKLETDHVTIRGAGGADHLHSITSGSSLPNGELFTVPLQGIDVDLENTPDLLPTVAALASVAQGTSNIVGVEHARFKETDRVHTMALELSKLGVRLKEKQDGLTIHGGAHEGVVESHGDHRLVMALTLVGLVTGGMRIKGASSHKVSFPNFPQVMQKLGCPVKVL